LADAAWLCVISKRAAEQRPGLQWFVFLEAVVVLGIFWVRSGPSTFTNDSVAVRSEQTQGTNAISVSAIDSLPPAVFSDGFPMMASSGKQKDKRPK
jgi:hypothetical protein